MRRPAARPSDRFALASATFLVTSLTLGNTDQSFLDYGWRITFLISIVLVGAGLYVRLTIEETPVFRAAQRQQPPHTPLREVFTQAPREILLAAAIYSGRFDRRTLIMLACGGAVVWSLLLFPLLDTHSRWPSPSP